MTLDRMVSAGCELEFQRSGEHSMRGYQELKKYRFDAVCGGWGMYKSRPLIQNHPQWQINDLEEEATETLPKASWRIVGTCSLVTMMLVCGRAAAY